MPLRVPQIQQEVQAQAPRVSSPTLVDVADPSQGLQALGRAAVDVAQVAQKWEAEADRLRLTQALVDLERRTNGRLMGEELGAIDAAFEGTNRRPGFLQSKGVEAAKVSGDVLKGFDTDIEEVGKELLPRQKQAFLERAARLRMEAERRVTAHVVQETERAKVEVVNAAKSELLREVGAEPKSPSLGLKAYLVEESIRGLASTPEGAREAVANLKAEVAITQISGFLSAGNVDDAEQVFREAKPHIGTKSDDVAALLKRARAGEDKKQLQVQATAQAQTWLRESTPAGGYVDAAKVLQQLQAVPANDPRREALEVEVRQQLQVEADRRKADTQRHREAAWRADLQGKAVPGSTSVWLEQFDPDFIRGLRNEREARWRRWKADAEGNAADRASARRKQAEDDEFLKLRYASLPPEEQARTTPEEFARVLAADFPDFSPSRNGYAAAGKVRADTVQRESKGDLQAERRFVAEAEREVMLLVTRKGRVDPDVARLGDPRTLVSGRASEFYRSKRAALGRDPTPDEEQAWLGELKLQPEPGWFRSKPPPAVLSPDFMPGGYGAPLPQAPTRPAAPSTRPAPRADVGTQSKTTSAARQAAEAWLAANPNHPKAAAVRAKLEQQR